LIAIDTNILVYSHREDSPWHKPALAIVKELTEGITRWCIPWPAISEFMAIVTHPKIYNPPTPLNVAFEAVESWLNSPQLYLISEGPNFFERLRKISIGAKVKGPIIHDARIAAICIDQGVKEIWSADRDFSRFKGIKVKNPLL